MSSLPTNVPPASCAADYNCSICMDLLYKPCVNTCGHTFCFWCFHHAMGWLKTHHACPLCRAPFRHFPAVCGPLHAYLNHTFPSEMASREQETKKLEQEQYHAESPAVHDVAAAAAAAAATQQEGQQVSGAAFDIREAFKCVECNGLAVSPTVLTCGHILCSKTAALLYQTSSKRCSVEGCVGKVVAQGEGKDSSPPAICSLIDSILRDNISDEEYQAAAHMSAQKCSGPRLEASQKATAAVTNSFSPKDSVILTGLTSAKGSQLNGTRATITSFCESTGRYTVSLACAIPDTPQSFRVKAENLQKAESIGGDTTTARNESYVHYGVGCDGCGVFPIQGRRYRCQDCSEEIGFDLCGECYDSGVHKKEVGDDGNVAAGRFNQQHRPHHKVEEVGQDNTFLHQLQAARPDLALSQIVQMLNMEFVVGPSDGDEDDEDDAHETSGG